MKKDHQDVVIFPGWKKQLERSGLDALKEKRYGDALESFEKLELFEAASYEILTGKVICFIELGRYDEAIGVCRRLMKEDDDNYYKYLHIYVTILFQTSQYGEIVSLLDEIFSNEEVPHTYRQQFWQIYELSKNFYQEQADYQFNNDINQFIHKLKGGSFQEQWRMLSSIRNKSILKYVEELVPYLTDSTLNPVIKTGILQCFYEQKVDRNFEVSKFDQTKVVNPIELKDIMDSSFAKQVLHQLSFIEQEDPTLFEFSRQILFRFLYIYYPFIPIVEDIYILSDSVLALALEYLQLDERNNQFKSSEDVRKYWMDQIRYLEMKYFSQIE